MECLVACPVECLVACPVECKQLQSKTRVVVFSQNSSGVLVAVLLSLLHKKLTRSRKWLNSMTRSINSRKDQRS